MRAPSAGARTPAGVPRAGTAALDLATRLFWKAAGRPVDLAAAQRWLAAPTSSSSRVGDGWLAPAAAELGGAVDEDAEHAGLLPDLSQLDGPGFAAADLRPEIRDFYEHTSDWRMEAWTQWSAPFKPDSRGFSSH